MPPDHPVTAWTSRADPDAGTGRGAVDAVAAGAALSGVARGDLRRQPRGDLGGLSQADGADSAAGPVSGGGRGASGGGGADGAVVRQARGRGDLAGPNFTVGVPPGGYGWWYVDGISADGTRALSVIGFVGSVFSPWYHWSGRGDPANHCCLNVVLAGAGPRCGASPIRCRSGPAGCTGPGVGW